MSFPKARASRRNASVELRIREAVAQLPEILRLDEAVIELREFNAEAGVAILAVTGECQHCQLSAATFLTGLEAHVRRHVPEVREVRLAES